MQDVDDLRCYALAAVWPAAAVLLAAGAVVAATLPAGPARLALVAAFLLLGPGLPVAGTLHSVDVGSRTIVAALVSVGLSAGVALLLLGWQTWEPLLAVHVLALGTVAAALLQLAGARPPAVTARSAGR